MKHIIHKILDNELVLNNFFDHRGSTTWEIKQRTTHDNMLVYGISGEGYYCINDKQYAIKPHRVFFISSGTPHHAKQTNITHKVVVYAIRFSVLQNQLEMMENCSFVYDLDTTFLLPLFSEYSQFHSLGKENLAEVSPHFLHAIFNTLLMQKHISETKPKDAVIESIARVLDTQIQQNAPIILEDILSTFSLTYYELLHRFKASFGMTIKGYIFSKKMEYAKQLLLNTDLKLHQISQEIGYSDPYIFSNQFKKHFKKSPRDYRKNL